MSDTVISQMVLDDLILHDVRYCLGRLTWVPAECCARVRKFWGQMSPERRTIVARDVNEHIDRRARMGQPARGCWVGLSAWMEAN
jgi:hypothetical protein